MPAGAGRARQAREAGLAARGGRVVAIALSALGGGRRDARAGADGQFAPLRKAEHGRGGRSAVGPEVPCVALSPRHGSLGERWGGRGVWCGGTRATGGAARAVDDFPRKSPG